VREVEGVQQQEPDESTANYVARLKLDELKLLRLLKPLLSVRNQETGIPTGALLVFGFGICSGFN